MAFLWGKNTGAFVKSLAYAVVVVVAMGSVPGAADEVTCESHDNQRAECDMDTRGGISLVRHLSSSPCIEGKTWGVSGQSVWVTNGCRAVFASQGEGVSHGETEVTCESHDNQRAECEIDTRGGVSLVRHLSSSPCVEGKTWGVSGDNVWVSNGCRAVFAAGHQSSSSAGGEEPEDADEVTCESHDNQRAECDMVTRAGVRMVRQLSRSPCTEGQTWGVFPESVWVSDGCRAVFASGEAGSSNSSF